LKNLGQFYHPIRVRFAETDMQGHVFFGNYFTYFDVAAMAYMRAIGYGYYTMIEEGVDMVYASTRCDYKDRAFFDETLHVFARVAQIGNTSLHFAFDIREAQSRRQVAQGKIVAVTVDAQELHPIPVPATLRKAVAAFEGGAANGMEENP